MKLCKALWVTVPLMFATPAFAQGGADKPADEEKTETAEGDAAGDGEEKADAEKADGEDAEKADEKKADEGKATTPPPTPTDDNMDGATYTVRLRDLESQVDELKEQIRRSHTRLSLLSDTILSGGVGGSRAEVSFTNNMSNAFRLVRALFVLDGAVQYNKKDESKDSALAKQKHIPIFNGSIPPGDHTLQALIQLRGHGYGVFSYLRGYKFEVKSSHSFTITEGKTIAVEAIAYEKGGVTTPLEQRPAIRYVERIRSGTGAAPAQGGKPKQKPGKSGFSGGFSVGGK